MSHKLQQGDLWNEEDALMNKLNRLIGLILCSCPRTYREVVSSAPRTSSPTLPRGCQIYCYPWRALIRNLEQDLQSHLEYWLVSFFFFFLSPLRGTARGHSWDIASHTRRNLRMNNARTHANAHIHARTLLLGSLGSYSLPHQSV